MVEIHEQSGFVSPHWPDGDCCLRRQLAQAEERVADPEVALSLSDSNTQEAQERAEKAEGERDNLFFELDELQCDIASALGWDCHGIVFHRLVRGYVMAHEMERAEVARLREALDYRIRRVPEIALPTEADLDRMMNAFQRHTGAVGDHSDADTIPMEPDRIPESMRRWWKQNVMDGAINARVAIGIIIRTWEAGRAKAEVALAAKETEK